MACELMACCQFFKDNMEDLPKAAEYIKNKLCLGDYKSCGRYQVFKEYGGKPNIPPHLYSGDIEEVKKATQCLRKKQEPEPSG